MERFDVVIIGAGAAGMMCALEAGRRSRRVLLVDHNISAGDKIRISGGGRCNFTNMHIEGAAYLSQNPKFALSALKRFSQWDFIDRLAAHGIKWHEKTLGQLFCDGSARRIVDMLLADMAVAGVVLRLGVKAASVRREGDGFMLNVGGNVLRTSSLVVATGGMSIPKMGASGFGYDIARQFGLALVETQPGLVPLTFDAATLADLKPLAGLSCNAAVSCNGARFEEGLLFTHRGLSGPSILQISSYWRQGDAISVDLMPGGDGLAFLRAAKQERGRQSPARVLAEILPRRLAQLVARAVPEGRNMADLSDAELAALTSALKDWRLIPSGSEGYRTAEVTLGGVSTGDLSSKTMQARAVPGLYFIGEVVDVTGWLGGYNFQWAWSSGWAAGQVA
ncbi:MAG: NAD(P)/FAD-dependent oxidoreductase [Alphaproteobacteria bacterium]|nr:NAD(P)/FAD-dependent oxidoreductase [Alphaproteobacteria bacterium]